MKTSKYTILNASLGVFIEYYDYSLFFVLLPLIAPVFFPNSSSSNGLFKGYLILSISVILRPLGGLVFGYIGDYISRRKALLFTIYGIGTTTILIGLIPPYQTIGVWAIILLVITKSLQVFFFGGEYNGAGVFVVEHAKPSQEGFYSGILTSTMLSGGLLASLVGVLITFNGAPAWAWRGAFILGGIISLIAILFRRTLIESPQFIPAQKTQHGLVFMLKKFPIELSAGFFCGAYAGSLFATLLVFINPMLKIEGLLSVHQVMIYQSILSLVAVLTLLTAGWLSDKASPRITIITASILMLIMVCPVLFIIDLRNKDFILPGLIILMIITEIGFAPSNAFLKNIFPSQFRYRATSLSFGFGLSLCGGLTPIINSLLFKYFDNKFIACSYWIIFLASCLLISCIFSKKHP
ncbi:MAG: MFS transporter [Burkholderiales bacterium]|nr:MFS transporter [Burkholderiales bacterium]